MAAVTYHFDDPDDLAAFLRQRADHEDQTPRRLAAQRIEQETMARAYREIANIIEASVICNVAGSKVK